MPSRALDREFARGPWLSAPRRVSTPYRRLRCMSFGRDADMHMQQQSPLAASTYALKNVFRPSEYAHDQYRAGAVLRSYGRPRALPRMFAPPHAASGWQCLPEPGDGAWHSHAHLVRCE